MDDVELASAYRLTATNFRMSANILFEEFQKRGELLPNNRRAIPFYFLISHAVELLLKCALLKKGLSAQELKKFSSRHNLQALLEMLIQRGVHVSDSAVSLICALGGQQKSHVLRYTALLDNGEDTFTPEPSILFELLDELLLAGRTNKTV
jgi:hypothetical protein